MQDPVGASVGFDREIQRQHTTHGTSVALGGTGPQSQKDRVGSGFLRVVGPVPGRHPENTPASGEGLAAQLA